MSRLDFKETLSWGLWLNLPVPPNKSLQGSVNHKVLGRGRSGVVLEQVLRARVLNRWRAAPELSR
jgi:hypothetical protein